MIDGTDPVDAIQQGNDVHWGRGIKVPSKDDQCGWETTLNLRRVRRFRRRDGSGCLLAAGIVQFGSHGCGSRKGWQEGARHGSEKGEQETLSVLSLPELWWEMRRRSLFF